MSFLTRDGVINDPHEFQRRQTSKPVMCGEVVMKNKVLMDTFVDILNINGGKGEDISNASSTNSRDSSQLSPFSARLSDTATASINSELLHLVERRGLVMMHSNAASRRATGNVALMV